MPLEEFKRIVPLADPDTLEEMEEVEGLNIKYLLNQGATEYRKRPLRMHLIEPFLIVLNRRGVGLFCRSCGPRLSLRANEAIHAATRG